jgi:hypothetical protein
MNTRKVLGIGAALVLMAAAAWAQSAEGDFETGAYTDGTLYIKKYVGWDSVVTVPAAIGGKAVSGIGKEAFAKLAGLTGVTLPDSVTHIGESAFSTNKLASVTFGKGLRSIGKQAFYDNSLTSVTLPDTVTFIGENAFARNKQLATVTLGVNARLVATSFIEDDKESHSKGWDTNDVGERGRNLLLDYMCNDRKAGTYTLDLKYRAPKQDGDFAYIATKYGAALTGYNGTPAAFPIPEKAGGLAVKYLHTGLFEGKTVERVRIPNTVTSIGDRAFYRQKLTSVDIPDSVTYIGDSAFAANNGYNQGTLTSVTIGKGVMHIGASAFYNQKMTSVDIPDSVTYIGAGAFSGTPNDTGPLTSVTIGKGVKSIGDKVFYHQNLTSVVIPDGVTSIGDNAFDRNKLTSVVIPDSVTYIGEEAFPYNKLTSVVIPDGVTYIGDRAFYMNNLTSVTIGNGVVLGSSDISCADAYNKNGKKAGVYTNTNNGWTYTARD